MSLAESLRAELWFATEIAAALRVLTEAAEAVPAGDSVLLSAGEDDEGDWSASLASDKGRLLVSVARDGELGWHHFMRGGEPVLYYRAITVDEARDALRRMG